ncbi:hypothetical protein Acid345_0471 [Candidatus Koribacter versatilis Ellin345]|uniref:Uncharacterized protein n=1 Tax=Koribacter versatilis (strain Ellin345) TaxID=204669 RepID=Q1IUH4_KORVE|nr:hypothetical protein [Candidatus Koribacter versatilis]ABF39476.1 hypothetical protein Acid345_0471 [Candidatus Koribacter versatilis Ellin345]
MTTFRLTVAVVLAFVSGATVLSPAQHEPPRAKIVSPHGALGLACENCHTYTAWRPLRAVPEFNHDKTKYPLRGTHVNVSCRQCHTSLVFSNVGMKCSDCHADFHRRQMGANCESCHTVKGWKVGIQAIQNHQNRFPLVGAHATTQCEDCHVGAASGKFAGLSTDCYSCHSKQFATPVLDHRSSGFPVTCESCHTMDTWLGAKFDHLKFTGFALTGMHAKLDCTACHLNGKFSGTPASCYGCHTKEYNGTTNPSHVNAGFPRDCGMCHSTSSWLRATFDHNKTKFPLTGGHKTVKCESCHIGGNFKSLPTDCSSCHLSLFKTTTNPSHTKAGFPTDCSICHTTANWTSASFDHGKYTKFPLTGTHQTLKCVDCHVGGNYTGTPASCSGCHMKDYTGAKTPNHAAAGFPTQCQMCHSTTAWKPSSFDHSKSKFPLTGAHSSVQCASCHVGGNYTTLPTDCVGCHLSQFKSVKDPNHVTLGWPTDCTICHTTATWADAHFDHTTYTKYPLSGKHATVACLSCHVGGKYAGTPADCASCHIKDYNGTTDPNHKAAGFPTDCSICHATAGWKPATFDHNKTKFPLTGQHTKVDCIACHKNGVYAGLPTTCVSCHLNDFNKTTSPNHKTSGFPTTCEVCHSTNGWIPASFDHSKTSFPLTGQHTKIKCDDCHKGSYNGSLPKDCYSCHKTDYNATSNPNHKAAMFPTTCNTCHNTTTWLGAVFNHTWFPIYSGSHAGRWTSCGDCHTNSANYAVFSCITCHQHSQANTDPHHKDVRGYSYGPTTCYSCHPTGTAGD